MLVEFPDDLSKPNPNNDGITHINTYSKAKTKLGRMLSNFYPSTFTYEPYGTFASGESFWYWYLTGQKHNELKSLVGFEAKKQGRKYNHDRIDINGLTDEHIEVLSNMLVHKIIQNKDIQTELINSTLPFIHYYNYNGCTILIDCQWMLDTFVDIRYVLQNKDIK